MRPDQPRHGHRGRPEWQERKRAPNAVYSDRIGRIERLVIMYSVLEIWSGHEFAERCSKGCSSESAG